MIKSSTSYRPGDVILGRFTVKNVFQGGMGEVYLCIDEAEGIPIGLKTWRADLAIDEHTYRQFTEEIAVWLDMQPHPNVVRCLGLAREGKRLFMQLEWITPEEGRQSDLRSWINGTALFPKDALRFAIDICRGILHARSQHPGFVHRDLKPGNILIDRNRVAKITDFGLATFLEKSNLRGAIQSLPAEQIFSTSGADGLAGTPMYMSPEQWLRQPVDERTDVYAIGCILCEMLSGAPPYRSTTLAGLQREHLFAPHQFVDVPDITPLPATTKPGFFARLFGQSRNHAAPRESLAILLNETIAYCTAKAPEQRYTLQELIHVLESIYTEYFGQLRSPDLGKGLVGLEYTAKAATFLELGLLDKALENMETAVRMAPNDSGVHSNLGNLFAQTGQIEKALTSYNRALQLDPRNTAALSARGNLYDDLRQFDKALADLNLALILDPFHPVALNNRSVTYDHIGQHDLALQDANQAIALAPDYAKAYNNRATTLMSMQRFSEAMSSLSRAIEIHPYYAKAYFNRGLIHAQEHRQAEAFSDFDSAIECNPSYAKAYYQRAAIYQRQARYDKALPDVAKAIELGFHDPNAMALLSLLSGKTRFLVHDERAGVMPISALPPVDRATWYAEGVNLGQAPFVSRLQAGNLPNRRPLILWSAPPSEEVFVDLIRAYEPSEIYLFGHNTCDDSFQGTLEAVTGMCKYAISRDGIVSTKKFAARLGMTNIVITMSLFWLTLNGMIKVVGPEDKDGVMVIGPGSGNRSEADEQVLQSTEEILLGSLADISAYRRYFRSSTDLLNDLRRMLKEYYP